MCNRLLYFWGDTLAQIEGEQYKQVNNWTCPNCGAYRKYVRFGLRIESFWPPYVHCIRCNGYFLENAKRVPDHLIRELSGKI